MQVDVKCSPASALAYCYLTAGESVRCEAGAMAAMSGGISVKADAGPGGLVKGMLRKGLGGESFWMGRYTADVHGAWVALAPKFPGDIAVVDLTDGGIVAEAGSLLALSDGVSADVKFAGLRHVMLHEGATLLRLHGEGKAVVSSYGGLQRFELGPDEHIIIDTGHLVAYSDTMRLRVGPLSGLMTAAFSGEGLVGILEGPGTVWIQTRAEQALKSWLMPEHWQNTDH